MTEYLPEEGPGQIAARMARRGIGVLILLVVMARVFAIVTDYATDQSGETDAAVEATQTPEAAEEVPGAGESETDQQAEATNEEGGSEAAAPGKVVVVIIPGLNFRTEPKSSAEVMRSLPEGTRLTLVSERSGWYQVRDEDGITGWVSSSSQYVRVEEPEAE